MSSSKLSPSDREEGENVEAKLWQKLALLLTPAGGTAAAEVEIMRTNQRILKLKKYHQWLFAAISKISHAAFSASTLEENLTEPEKLALSECIEMNDFFSFEGYMTKVKRIRPTFEQGKNFLWLQWCHFRKQAWDQNTVYVSAAEDDIFAVSLELLDDAAPGECICGATVTAKCARCQCVGYCSRVCQKISWPTHKTTCRAPESSVSAAGGST
jgi:hypothetical protein